MAKPKTQTLNKLPAEKSQDAAVAAAKTDLARAQADYDKNRTPKTLAAKRYARAVLEAAVAGKPAPDPADAVETRGLIDE